MSLFGLSAAFPYLLVMQMSTAPLGAPTDSGVHSFQKFPSSPHHTAGPKEPSAAPLTSSAQPPSRTRNNFCHIWIARTTTTANTIRSRTIALMRISQCTAAPATRSAPPGCGMTFHRRASPHLLHRAVLQPEASRIISARIRPRSSLYMRLLRMLRSLWNVGPRPVSRAFTCNYSANGVIDCGVIVSENSRYRCCYECHCLLLLL